MAVIDHMHRPATGRGGVSMPAGLGQLAQVKSKLPFPVLLYLLAVVIPIGFQVGPLAMTTLRLLLLIMIVPLMIRLLSGAYGKVFLTDVLFIAHILWAIVALAVNNPDQVVQQVGSVGIEFLGGYVMGRAYCRSRDDFIALCRALTIIVLLTIPLALYETMTGRPPVIEILRKIPGLTSVGIVSYERRMGLERVQAVFAHPIHYGLFCSVTFSLVFVALRDLISTTSRYTLSTLVAGAGFLALSSGALLAITLQFFLIIWAGIFAASEKKWWILIGMSVLGYLVIDILSNRTPLDVFMSYATFSPSNAYWRKLTFEWGMINIRENPLFGIGLNDWKRASFMEFNSSVDNFWLLTAMRYGIPGFLFIFIGYFYAITIILFRQFKGDKILVSIRRAWVFTFLGLSFTLTTVHVWTNVYCFVFFMFGAGMWLITAKAGPAGSAAQAGPVRQGTGFAAPAARQTMQPAPKAAGPHFTRFPPVTDGNGKTARPS